MGNPGSLTSQMPPRPDDMARRVKDQERTQREQAAGKTAQAMQIGNGGILVTDGGAITFQGTGALNTSGALTTSNSFTAGTSIGAGTTVTAGSTVTAGGDLVSTGGGLNVFGGASVGGALSCLGISAASLSTTGDVTTSGRVVSTGIIRSSGTKANTVTVGYSAVYIDVNGDMGGNTSSARYKQDIEPVTDAGAGLLGLTIYRFRYIAAVEKYGDDAPWEYGLIAEEVVKTHPWACFYEDDGVTVRGINYDRLIVSAIDVLQDHESRLDKLERGTK